MPQFVARDGLICLDNANFHGSITASQGISGTASYAVTASYVNLANTASYTVTASYLNFFVTDFISGSNFSTSIVTAKSTPLSFTIGANEIWSGEAYLTTQCSGNGGVKYAFSSSNVLQFVNGWVIGTTNNITTQTEQRFTNANTLTVTPLHTTAATPAPDLFHFMVVNGLTSSVLSIAVASATNGQLTIVYTGSYMIARRMG